MNDDYPKNRRILVVDDSQGIHEDFRSILKCHDTITTSFNDAKAAIFGDTSISSGQIIFEADSAFQGQEGLEKVKQALNEGRPYAMAFVDVRMPPGWDGIETIERIWQVYPELQVVICTAYSDYKWSDVIKKLGQTERLLILKKPFDNVEVYQLASALTEKWNLARQASVKMDQLEQIVKERTDELIKANDQLKQEIAERQRAEERLRIRNTIARVFLTIPGEQVFGEVLQTILKVTESKHGIFGYINEDGALVCPSLTSKVWDKCQGVDKSVVFPRDKWDDSLWCQAIRDKKTLYSNEPSHVPDEHIPIDRDLAVPIIHETDVIGLIHITNKATDYDAQDVELLEDIVVHVIAPVLYARLLEDRQDKARRRAEEALEQVNKDLESAVQELSRINKELQEFAYIAAHDLKTPLRAIGTLADWLSTDYSDKFDEKGQKQIKLLVTKAKQMSALIDDILQYSRVGKNINKKQEVDLNIVLSEVIGVIDPPQNIEITVENGIPTVLCNKTHIIQVFQNLIGNAIKYMDKPKGQIKVGCIEQDDFWKFYVTDDGPGIDKKYFEKIFKIFQTLSPRDERVSTGIGLSIVKKLVEMNKGNVWLESEIGKGSTFFFTLPKQNSNVTAKLDNNSDTD